MFKVNNRSTRTSYEIFSKLTIKTPDYIALIWHHMHNLKKREKHPWRSVAFSKVAGYTACQQALCSVINNFSQHILTHPSNMKFILKN